jgi:coatomer subunit beta
MTVILASSSTVTFYVRDSSSLPTSTSSNTIDVNEMKKELEHGDDGRRIAAMQTILAGMVNGDSCVHSLLMNIIRFVVPSKNKTLHKLLLLYLENVNKVDADGKLRQEMILVWYKQIYICKSY